MPSEFPGEQPVLAQIPLPLELADFATALDKLVESVESKHLILHDRRIDHVVNRPPRERQHPMQRPLRQHMLKAIVLTPQHASNSKTKGTEVTHECFAPAP